MEYSCDCGATVLDKYNPIVCPQCKTRVKKKKVTITTKKEVVNNTAKRPKHLYRCMCGLYQGEEYKNITCEVCGNAVVDITGNDKDTKKKINVDLSKIPIADMINEIISRSSATQLRKLSSLLAKESSIMSLKEEIKNSYN